MMDLLQPLVVVFLIFGSIWIVVSAAIFIFNKRRGS